MSRGWKVGTSIGLSLPILGGLAAFGAYLSQLLSKAGGSDLESSVTMVSLFFLGSVGGAFGLFLVLSPASGFNMSTHQLPSTAIFYGAFAAAVLAGTVILALNTAEAIAFPPFYVLAATTPSLGVVAFATRLVSRGQPKRNGETFTESDDSMVAHSWLRVAGSLLVGTYVSVPLAMIVELVVGAILFLAVFAFLFGGTDILVGTQNALLGGAGTLERVSDLVQSPPVLAGILILLAVVAPIVEELAKSLGVVLTKSYRTAPTALIAGVAAGAGFSMVESIFYLSFSLSLWPAVAVLRIATVFMHTLGSGLMGLGWFAALQQKRVSRFFVLFGGAVGVHGLWNAATVTMLVLGLRATGLPPDSTAAAGAELAIVGVFLLMAALAAGSVIALVLLARRVRAWQSLGD